MKKTDINPLNFEKSNLFFTSDTHFYHDRIIELCKRPFRNVTEMNEEMIKRWNEKVPENGTVFHLGDFALKCSPDQCHDIIDRLNGKIILIKGNHERVAMECKERFQFVIDRYELKFHDPRHLIVLDHYCMAVWNKSHHGAWHLYGHSHGTFPDDPNAKKFDIGVDCHNFYPLSYTEVETIMKTKKFVPIDHHTGN